MLFVPFLYFEAHGCCINIFFYNFHMNSIEISSYCKFVMTNIFSNKIYT
jgi:hypothetical protein